MLASAWEAGHEQRDVVAGKCSGSPIVYPIGSVMSQVIRAYWTAAKASPAAHNGTNSAHPFHRSVAATLSTTLTTSPSP